MVCLVIPALNEAEVIGEVVRSVPRTVVNQIIVVVRMPPLKPPRTQVPC